YVVAGGGPWTPLGAEQVGSGYQVVWKNGTLDQYSLWTTDGDGNFLSSTGLMSGSSYAIESLEADFHQDFNANGTIGTGKPTVSNDPVTPINPDNSASATMGLLANYMASAFTTPGDGGMGATVDPQSSGGDFLAKPPA